MTNRQQPKIPMYAVKSLSDPGASQGARKATEDAPAVAPQCPEKNKRPCTVN